MKAENEWNHLLEEGVQMHLQLGDMSYHKIWYSEYHLGDKVLGTQKMGILGIRPYHHV